MKHIVVLGGGHGGAQAVMSLREEGFDGSITLVSSEGHLPYHRPPLSKEYLKSAPEPKLIHATDSYAAKDIGVRLGQRVTVLDLPGRRLAFASGEQIEFDGLVYAAGSRARILPGADGENVHYLKDIDDAERLRQALAPGRNIVLIGGGFIGLEAAASARSLGCNVTVLEAAPRLMGRTSSEDVAAHMHRCLAEAGIDIRVSTTAASFENTEGRISEIALADGMRMPVDAVLVGIGAVANVELAEAAGLACENGVVVDTTLRTSAPNVVAIGDCASFPYLPTGQRVRLESVQNATEQAKTAAATLLGSEKSYDAVPWFWSDQGAEKLQMAGLWSPNSRQVVRGKCEDGRFSVFHFEGDRFAGVEAVNRPADYMFGRRLLAGGKSLPIEAVADESVDLKRFL